jgi:carboxymethylenebutenolidase
MTATATLTLARDRERSFDAYLARRPDRRAPGIVVLHDMFGLNEPIRAVADRYASLGYAALVPNLFWRSEIPQALSYDQDQHSIAWARLNAMDLDIVTADMRLAVDWLRAQPYSNGKVAAVGFCGGGRFAFLAAVRCGVDGAAALYGLGISQHLGEIGNACCPLQLHYGLKDQHIPRQEIDTVAAGVRGRPSVEMFLYPDAGHSFANPVRPTYDAAATKLADGRIERMLESMRGSGR